MAPEPFRCAVTLLYMLLKIWLLMLLCYKSHIMPYAVPPCLCYAYILPQSYAIISCRRHILQFAHIYYAPTRFLLFIS